MLDQLPARCPENCSLEQNKGLVCVTHETGPLFSSGGYTFPGSSAHHALDSCYIWAYTPKFGTGLEPKIAIGKNRGCSPFPFEQRGSDPGMATELANGPWKPSYGSLRRPPVTGSQPNRSQQSARTSLRHSDPLLPFSKTHKEIASGAISNGA